MIPIYQTKIDKKYGNCMQAVYASLFELSLEEVPDLTLWWGDDPPDSRNWGRVELDFVKEQGYRLNILNSPIVKRNGKPRGPESELVDKCCFPALSNYSGVNGYHYGVVLSPKYHEINNMHAVVIDNDFNIVHDPNPNNKDLKEYPNADVIGYNGLVQLKTFTKIK